jgi:hypothetical protein
VAQDNRDDVGFGFKVPAEIADKLTRLQDAVRAENHHRPSQRVMVSALIHAADEDGAALEATVLASYRSAFPEESRDK